MITPSGYREVHLIHSQGRDLISNPSSYQDLVIPRMLSIKALTPDRILLWNPLESIILYYQALPLSSQVRTLNPITQGTLKV